MRWYIGASARAGDQVGTSPADQDDDQDLEGEDGEAGLGHGAGDRRDVLRLDVGLEPEGQTPLAPTLPARAVPDREGRGNERAGLERDPGGGVERALHHDRPLSLV